MPKPVLGHGRGLSWGQGRDWVGPEPGVKALAELGLNLGEDKGGAGA